MVRADVRLATGCSERLACEAWDVCIEHAHDSSFLLSRFALINKPAARIDITAWAVSSASKSTKFTTNIMLMATKNIPRTRLFLCFKYPGTIIGPQIASTNKNNCWSFIPCPNSVIPNIGRSALATGRTTQSIRQIIGPATARKSSTLFHRTFLCEPMLVAMTPTTVYMNEYCR